MEFRTTTVGDMLEGFTDNMSEEQIDKELKLFRKVAKELGMKKDNYDTMGVLIDEDHLVDGDTLEVLRTHFGYMPYKENNQASGHIFLYFETSDHAEAASAYLKKHMEGEF